MWENKITKAIEKIVFGLMLCCFAYFGYKALQKAQKPAIQTNKDICEYQKKQVYSGVIIKNFWSRGSFGSQLNSGNLFQWRCKSKVRNVIEVGDSIYKPSGTFDTYIYKKANPDSVILIKCDFDCDYWEKRYENKK